MPSYRKSLTPTVLQASNAQAASWGVDILTIGHDVYPPIRNHTALEQPDHAQYDWHEGRTLTEFQLVYIANGQGVFESATTPPTLVEGGMAFLLFPTVWYRFKPLDETGWEEFWVECRGQYIDYLTQQACFSPIQPLIRIHFRSDFSTVFARLVDSLTYKGAAHRQRADYQVIQLLGLVYASALIGDTSRTRREQIVHQVRYRLHTNWHEPVDFELIASELNVSYVWFRKAFKEVVGVSPGQYHLNLRLEKASLLLRETTLSVSDISHQTGFDSLVYFSRIFKKKMNATPSDYRRLSGNL
ncbi:helix-turn-helix transcriptional regulator [Fibrella sp. USSR17]